MRSIAVLLAVASLAVAPGARAHTVGGGGGEHEYFGAIPCAVACSYWVGNGFTPCERPFPPGSYLDHITNPAPAPPPGRHIIILEATLDAEVDWDLFLCRSSPPYTELLVGTGQLYEEPCDNRVGDNSPLPIGCHEDFSAVLVAGQTVIMRAYNWSDALPAMGRWGHTFV